MINAEDKKNIVVVVLILIILLGSLFFIKSCNRQEYIDDNQLPDVDELPIDDGNSEEEDQVDGSLEEVVDDVEDTQSEVVFLPSYPDKEEEPALPPVISIPDQFVVSLNDKGFQLPDVSGVDSKGVPLKVEISYYFKPLSGLDYSPVLTFSTDQVGTYRVVYRVTNSDWLTTVKEVYVEVVDQEAPKIEGMIEEYDPETGSITFIPVPNSSLINQMIKIHFTDNDAVSYAEYYKLNEEQGNDDTTEEPLPEIIPIDPTSELVLFEDGEYHIRAYDASGNVVEYVVTIDCTNPVVSVTYTMNANSTLVVITSDEELQPVDGWVLSDDGKTLTKEYTQSTQEVLSLFDLAGNQVDLPLVVEVEYIELQVFQDGKLTTSEYLNIVDGEITLGVDTNLSDYEIFYTIDGGSEEVYHVGDSLTVAGDYVVSVYSDGILYDTIHFFISTDLGGD